jgi:hypothetical protein
MQLNMQLPIPGIFNIYKCKKGFHLFEKMESLKFFILPQ